MDQEKLESLKTSVLTIFLVLVFGIIFASVAVAQDDDLISGQDPSVTLAQIFEPIQRFISWVAGLIDSIILHLFDWDWIRGIFVSVFNFLDDWILKITGNDLAGVFRIIGHTLAEVFRFVLNFIKSLWPF